MDVTLIYYFETVSNCHNKNNSKVKDIIKHVNTLISEYRLEAMYNKGFIRDYCNKEANYLENQLKLALGNKRKLN